MCGSGSRRGSVAMSSLLYYALPALGSYAVLSVFFLRRPRLLHTPWAPVFLPRLGAHRAGELGGGVEGRTAMVATEGGVRTARLQGGRCGGGGPSSGLLGRGQSPR